MIFLLFGWLIWKKQQLILLTGYDESTFKGNKNQLTKEMGIFSICYGIAIIFVPIVEKFLADWVL
nr:DUF3784 domain-containing protein [Virgibacillus proomii]